MEKEPLVFIIILNFNSVEETIRCIESVKSIQYSNYKIVVVDNNSTDCSGISLRKRAEGYVFIGNEDNLGYARGNNVGVEYALKNGADYICILNNDVEVEKNFLSKIIDYMKLNAKVGIAGPCICDFQHRDKIQSMGANINLYTGLAQPKKKNLSYSAISEEPMEVDYLGGACFVARREVFNTIGYIPQLYFLFFEETEFCLKAKKAGYKLVSLKASRIYHKQSATISKYKGLSYFFLNRNRIVFMRRNANGFQKSIFLFYIMVESLGRILFRGEPWNLFRIYYEGLKADINSIDMEKVNYYLRD